MLEVSKLERLNILAKAIEYYYGRGFVPMSYLFKKRNYSISCFLLSLFFTSLVFSVGINSSSAEIQEQQSQFLLPEGEPQFILEEIGQVSDGSGHAMDVFVSGDYAYVADDSDGLEIIDISTPSAPVEV